MTIVIVTKQCFLVAEHIVSIVLDETAKHDEEVSTHKIFKKKKVPLEDNSEWLIDIKFIPENTMAKGSSGGYSKSNADYHSLEIRVFGRKSAFNLFGEIVREIQDQSPSNLFLDQLVEKVLNQELDDVN